MLIHSVTLNNIRSYQQQTIDFHEGITLLAGDIGSGKSTILLAIEFALFGIRRGDISGDGLLRHGEQEGSVTLTFQTNDTYTIHRQLKRSSQGVRQDGGYLESTGERELLTANELKARVLAILGYPEALLTKTKGFVFRYTVYTPQEEMKQILYENDQSRLETLRALFGVDKYQVVQDNATLIAKRLRDDKRELDARLHGEEDLKEKQRQLASQLRETSEQLKTVSDDLFVKNKSLSELTQELNAQEALLEQERARQKQLLTVTTQHDALTKQIALLSGKITAQQSILTQERQVVENPEQALSELRERISLLREKRAQATAKQSEFTSQQNALTAKLSTITDLSTCPTCQQDVTQSHKDHIEIDTQKELSEVNKKQASLALIFAQLKSALDDLEQKQLSLTQRKRLYDEYTSFVQKQTLAKQQLTLLTQEEASLQEQLSSLAKQASSLGTPLASDAKWRGLKEEHSILLQEVAKKQNSVTQFSERKSHYDNRLGELGEQLNVLEQVKQQRSRLEQQERWLTHAFIPTVSIMEKHVLAAIHQEFSRLFTQWCQSLLDNEHIFATLTAGFAPQVTLHGYDADITHLSGGEKTSIALAYRLALNVVVNEFIQSLNTSDLLILDEPTDGFSSDQLDRVRDVLRELSVRQVLVVSHEQKMQSYVNQVLFVTKQESVSAVE